MKNFIFKLLFTFMLALTLQPAVAEGVITLESSFIGDREQPSVSFFIPWQGPSGPDSLYLDVESQIIYWLDEADRREISRLYDYYAIMDQKMADAASAAN